MKVILSRDVGGLGVKDDVKEVRNGYARNFLLPKGFAVLATPAVLAEVSSRKKRRETALLERTSEFEELADRLAGMTLRFYMKISAKGRAFGSITPSTIHAELKKGKVDVERDWILLDEPLKTIGEHHVLVRLPTGREARIQIFIEPES